MRLTLRTLLAYRDGALGPADSEDLHRRIQQNEYAGNLLRRVNAVAKRSYATSTIVGKGLGGDPNMYAEYLDDVMSVERIPEFERSCLESDEHLAELTRCHSLLCGAMHEGVAVSDSLRSTAVEIGSVERRDQISQGLSFRKQRRDGKIMRLDSAHQKTQDESDQESARRESADRSSPDEQAVQVQAPMVASGGGSIKPKGLDLEDKAMAANVPDYLVGRSSGNWRMPLAIGGLLALLAILIWQALGPLDGVRQLFVSTSEAPTDPDDAESLRAKRRADAEQASTASSETDAPPQRGSSDAGAELSPGNERTESATSNAAADMQSRSGNSETEPLPDTGSNQEPENAADPGSAVDAGADTSPPPSGLPAATIDGSWLPKDESERNVVLLSQTADGRLARLQPGDSLYEGLRLVVPAYYRTTLDLPGGALWTACGPSVMQLGAAQGTHLTTSLCRGLIRGGPLGNELEIDSPAGKCRLKLQGLASTASVEAGYRPKVNGAVVNADAYKPVLIIVSVEGQLELTYGDSRYEFGLGEGLALIGDAKPKEFKLQNIPQWYRASFERPIDQIAANDLVELLVPAAKDQVWVEARLAELTRHPRPYVAALAIQISIMTGKWDSFADGMLGNPRLSSYWTPTIRLAQQLIANDATAAESVRSAFSALSPDGDQLYQMLVGYSEEELTGGGLEMLVAQLGNENLTNRVLASFQLRQVTGKTLAYLPHDPNRASIQLWRRELAMNRLQVKPVGDLISERIPN